MGDTVLVEEKVPDSIELIKALDASDDRPTFAVWVFYEDTDEWRFLIAGPTFDQLLPDQRIVAYRKLVDAMAQKPYSSLSFSDVQLLQTDAPIVRSLHHVLQTDQRNLRRAHFVNINVNGIFIKEMIILRATQESSV